MNPYGDRWLQHIAIISVALSCIFARASEYEVKGIIRETIVQRDVSELHYTNEFCVFVRDCGWLIYTTENDGRGNVVQREVGSTNGTDIYESSVLLQMVDPAKQGIKDPRSSNDPSVVHVSEDMSQAFIRGNIIPVELLDVGMVGHLWLMFASQCYWKSLHTNRLTPVYDWHASIGADPSIKVEAEWELLGGPGSLPREVRYLGQWDETNGLYTATGTNSAGGVLLPSGFIFEQCFASVVTHKMVLLKRVDAEVTSFQAVCSRKSLLPVQAKGKTVIGDWRLKQPDSGNRIPSYIIQDSGKWPSVEEAKAILKAAQQPQDSLGASRLVESHRTSVVVALVCAFMLGPLGIYFVWKRLGKTTGRF
jgi:hypothetical protein